MGWFFKRIALALALAALALAQSPDSLVDGGHWKRSRAIVEPLVQSTPTDAHAVSLLSRVRWAYGDRKAALTLAEKAVSLDPNNAGFHFRLAEILGGLARDAGKLQAIGLASRFKKEIGAALTLDPKNTLAMFAIMLFDWEAPGIVGGSKDKAFAMAAEIAKTDPARASFGRARLASLEKDIAKQESFYLKAVELNPRYYAALTELAGLYASDARKKYDLAEKYARAAVKADEDRVTAYGILAEVYANTRRWADLDAVLAESEQHVPDDLTPFYRAAAILINQKADLPRAQQYLSKYLTQTPEPTAPTFAQARTLLGRAR